MPLTLQPIEIANIAALENAAPTWQDFFDDTKPVLELALNHLSQQRPLYSLYASYHGGDHRLLFATQKFKSTFGQLFQSLKDNLMPGVVEAFTDRLLVTGFTVEEGDQQTGDQAWQIWRDNRMDERALETHQEALQCGDAYVLVWPDDEGRARIFPQRADLCVVRYSEEQPGEVRWAVKVWRNDENFVRANVYYPDRIEKYVTRNKARGADLIQRASSFVQFEAPGEAWPLANPFGRVPIFHFANSAGLGQYGNSELKNLIPLQDALNKALADMLVAQEFAAFPQRWATGIEADYDDAGAAKTPFKPGIDRLWTSASEEAKFGQFDAAQLEQYLKVHDSLRSEIARVAGVPLHYLMMNTGNFPSGEALRIAEGRLVKKVTRKQTAWGNVWENVLAFALEVEGQSAAQFSAQWEPAATYSETEELNNLLVKKQLGASDEVLLAEAGYGEKEIAAMMEAKQAALDAQQKQFDAGNTGGL